MLYYGIIVLPNSGVGIMKEPSTSKPQLEAVERYQEGKSRFVLWYPDSVKEQLKKKKITAREVFEYGLKHYGIKVPT